MGVKDLSILIRKHVPSAITPHVNLTSFTGQTMAMDASLLTAKFHYSQSLTLGDSGDQELKESRMRCLRGWYNLLTRMKESGIKMIVVFDGDTRLSAKQVENDKRQATKELQREREVAEASRFARIELLSETWNSVKEVEREQVLQRYRHLLAQSQESVDEQVSGDVGVQAEIQRRASLPPKIHVDDVTASLLQMELEKRVESMEEEGAYTQEVQVDAGRPLDHTSVLEQKYILQEDNDQVARNVHPSWAEQPSITSFPELLQLQESSRQDFLAQRMVEFHNLGLNDQGNPIYSRNQTKISDLEADFFRSISGEHELQEVIEENGEEVIIEVEPVDLQSMVEQSRKLRKSHGSRALPIAKSTLDAVSELIHAFGIPTIKPSPDDPHEAEALCATLHALGHVDLVVSEDTDLAVYGAPMLRMISTRESGSKMNVLDSVGVREGLGLSRDEFVDLVLLCGTDFTERIPLLGPVKALALIKKYTTIENVLASQSLQPPDLQSYLQTVQTAREIFRGLPPLPEDLDLEQREPVDNLDDLLYHWGITALDEAEEEEKNAPW